MIALLSTLAANPVFAGILGGAGLSAVLYRCMDIPLGLYRFAKRQAIVTLEVDNSDTIFDNLCLYFSENRASEKSRWLKMNEEYSYLDGRWKWIVSIGRGWHFIRDAGSFYMIHREISDMSSGFSITRRETFTIRTLGRSQTALRALLERAERLSKREGFTRVHLWQESSFVLVDIKAERHLDTIFIPEEQKRRIVTDALDFCRSKDLYRRRGTPYRRGYLFEGPPGTGKTSLAFALSSHLRRPVYIININTAGGDSGLQRAFNSIGESGVVVMEDIDAASLATHSRSEGQQEEDVKRDRDNRQVTLSGLLNAVDGIASRDDRILIMTSNHPEKLDPALIRPGRVDLREHIGLLDDATARRMAELFLEGVCPQWIETNVINQLPISPAAMQGFLIRRAEDGNYDKLRMETIDDRTD